MNPKPRVSSNHFTVPCCTSLLLWAVTPVAVSARGRCPGHAGRASGHTAANPKRKDRQRKTGGHEFWLVHPPATESKLWTPGPSNGFEPSRRRGRPAVDIVVAIALGLGKDGVSHSRRLGGDAS